MIVIIHSPGRLGNKLFLFAHFIAFGLENRCLIANLDFDPYAKYFEATRQNSLCCYPGSSFLSGLGTAAHAASRVLGVATSEEELRYLCRGIIRKAHAGFKLLRLERIIRMVTDDERRRAWDMSDPEFISLCQHSIILVTSGWLFRDRTNLRKHAHKIHDVFAPIGIHHSRIVSLMQRARAGAGAVIGVHIRRGDYKNFMGGRFFYEFEQYAEIMRKVARNMSIKGQAKFLICSDESVPPETFFDLDVCMGTGEPIEDMYALAECDYLVSPWSSFSGWASYYGSVPWHLIQDPKTDPGPESFRSIHDLWVTG